MLKGFKDFILRGNVVDLAVGVVIGAAFTTVVNAIVTDVLTPLIGVIAKTPNFSNLTMTVNGSQFLYGSFLNALIAFLIDAIAVYFFVVLPINALVARSKKPSAPPASNTKKCPFCLNEIPIAAARCGFCTSMLDGGQPSRQMPIAK